MDEAGRRELSQVVEKDPRDTGKAFSIWTCADLVRHLVEAGHSQVSSETIRRHLHSLDYRPLRPVLSISSPDPDYATKAAQLEALKAQARAGEIILLFEDEIDLNLLPGVLRCWTRRGSQRKVPTPGSNQKRYGFGAVNFVTGHLTRHIAERKNSDGFCALIEQVVQAYGLEDNYQGPKVVLVIDNYIIHRSKKTLQVLAKYAKHLQVVALPTYAPKLNFIELLWKHLRRKVTHNHLFDSVAQLVDAVNDFFCHLDAHPAEVLSVMGCSE